MKHLISIASSRTFFPISNIPGLNIVNTVLLTILMLSASCRKNQDIPASPPTADSERSAQTAPLDPSWDPSNEKNPFDNIGALHNLLLDSAQVYINRTGDTTRSGIHEKIAQVFHGALGINPRLVLSKVDPAIDYGIAA